MLKVFERLIDIAEKRLGARVFLELLLIVGLLGLALMLARATISRAEVLAVAGCLVVAAWYVWLAYLRRRSRAASLASLTLAVTLTVAVPAGVWLVVMAPVRKARMLLHSAAAAARGNLLADATSMLTDALALARDTHDAELAAECACALGETQLGLGRLKEAAALLKTCTSLAAERSLPLLESRGLLGLSRLEILSGSFGVALLHAEQVRDRASAAHDEAVMAQAQLLLGQVAIATGDPEAARRLYEAACADLGTAAEPPRSGLCKLSLASHAKLTGTLPAAIELAEQALALFRQSHNLKGEADALTVLASAESAVAGSRRVYEHLQAAQSRYQKLGDSLSAAAVDLLLGRAERDTDPDSAQHRFDRAAAALQDQGAQPGYVDALLARAELARGLLRYDEARTDYRKAIVLAKEMNLRDSYAAGTLGLGELLRLRSENDTARQYFVDARALYAQGQNPTGQGHALRGIGNLDWLEDRQESARKAYDEALKLFEHAGHLRGAAGVYLARADLARSRRDLEAAERDYVAARGIFERLEARIGQANATLGLSHVEVGRQRYEPAATYLEEAQGLFKTANNPLGEANALCLRGDVERRLGRIPRARDYFKRSREIFRRHHEPLGLANLDMLEALALAHAGAWADAASLLDTAAREYEALDMQQEAAEARDKRLLVLRKKDPETITRSPGPAGHRTFH